MAKAAVRALDAAVSCAPAVLPASAEALIIGAGLTGLIIASELVQAGASIAILERNTSVGGVWRWKGNPHSRVNSTE